MNIPKPNHDLPDTSNNKDELSEHQIIRGVLLDLAQSLINGGGLQQGDTLGKMHFDAATERITRYYAAHIEIERLEATLDEGSRARDVAINHRMDTGHDIVLILGARVVDLTAALKAAKGE